jgi:hypothetical protein
VAAPGLVIALSLAASSSLARSSSTTLDELPMEQLAGKQVLIPVSIGEHKNLRFMLDTGANASVISPSTRTLIGAADGDRKAVAATGAGGDIANARYVRAERIKVGRQEYPSIVFGVVDISALGEPVAGILGQDFLRQNDIVLDFPHKRVRLGPAGMLAKGDVAKSLEALPATLELTPNGPTGATWVHVDATLNDAAVAAVFDLGADATVVNGRAAASARLKVSASHDSVVGADNRTTEGKAARATSLRLGRIVIASPDVSVADLAIFSVLGLGQKPAMVLGVDQFKDRVIAVSLATKTIYISARAQRARSN